MRNGVKSGPGGVVIFGDAAYCRQEVCETIIQNNGDWLLIVKDNQPKLHRAAQQSFVIPQGPPETHQRPPTESVERVCKRVPPSRWRRIAVGSNAAG